MIIDDLRLIIRLARKLQLKLQSGEYGDDGHKVEILRLLEIIQNLDLKQQYSIQRKELPPQLVGKCKLVYALASRAIREIQGKNYIPENLVAMVEHIINLEQEISTDLILPTKVIRKILNYSPAEAISHGILFRGISDQDYQKVLIGEPLFAPHPPGTLTITEHILDPAKAPSSQYISLTTDVKTAEHFGKVIIIQREFIRGHLFTPAEIEADLKRRAGNFKWTAPLRLQRKNSEFLLGPSRMEVARILPEAVINIKSLAA